MHLSLDTVELPLHIKGIGSHGSDDSDNSDDSRIISTRCGMICYSLESKDSTRQTRRL